MRQSLFEGLDDFKTLIEDSTAVKGNSAWRTDSSMLIKTSERIFNIRKRLVLYGLPNVSNIVWFELQINHLKSYAKEIAFKVGKKGATRVCKRLYRQLLKKVRRFV